MNNDSDSDSKEKKEKVEADNKKDLSADKVAENSTSSNSSASSTDQLNGVGQDGEKTDSADEDIVEDGEKAEVVSSKSGEKHDHLYTCLGEVMRDRRKSLQLSQEQLAAGSGIDRAFLSNLERGLRKPSFGTVARIAHGLKIKYSRLVAKCEKCQEERAKSA